jgi:restriction endonuclease S subunit
MLEKARTTSGLYSLSVGKVGELEVPLPSVSEQRALADAL